MPGVPNPTSPAAASLPCQSSDGEMSIGNDHNTITTAATSITRTSSQCSSQESSESQKSQLFHLCEAAAMQEKLVDDRDRDTTVAGAASAMESALSRKRMADGNLKDMSMSPVARGHSRNVSAISMASTSGSRIGELTAELKTRLSYAMVKVNHGWQTHTIDEVESLATQVDSPTSSSSTGRAGPRNDSTSPALSHIIAKTPDNTNLSNSTPLGTSQTHSPYDSYTDPMRRHSPNQAVHNHHARQRTALAPPAPIQPGQSAQRSTYIPTLLSQSQTASPRTPLPTASPYLSHSQPTPRSARPADPMLYSPHQTVRDRDQDAIEALMSMSSPGNNAHGHGHGHGHGYGHGRHTFSPAESPYGVLPRGAHHATTPGRHALPTGQPRKSLPTSRPPAKRVGFERDGDVEMGLASPHARGTPRGGRRTNGGMMIPPPLRTSLSLPAALGSGMGEGGPGGRRGRLKDEDIERMLERAAERSDSSDDEEIMLPSSQRTHTGVMS